VASLMFVIQADKCDRLAGRSGAAAGVAGFTVKNGCSPIGTSASSYYFYS
jgi:hypothetical protein